VSDGFPEIPFPDGRRAFAAEVHIDRTYAGLLEGTPTEKLNQEILSEVPRTMHRIFGDCPVFVLPPVVQRSTRQHPVLGVVEDATMPAVQVAMRFVSYEPISPGRHASQLVIVWHQDTWSPEIPDFIREQLTRIDWNAVAQDFCW